MSKKFNFVTSFQILFTVLIISLPFCFSSYPHHHEGDYDDDGFFIYSNNFRPNNMMAHNTFRNRNYDPYVPNAHYKHRNFATPMWRQRQGQRHGGGTLPPKASPEIFNVDQFGANSDGGDDSQAFTKAWEAACSSSTPAIIEVPRSRVYGLKPVKFSGPCKSQSISFEIYGTIEASNNPSDYEDSRHWIVFEKIDNLQVEGGGRIDGNGKIWWQKSCKVNPKLPCQEAPTAVTFMGCNNLMVSGLHFQNAQKMHLTFQDCQNVKASDLTVTAPGDSPNTDGIHVTGTQNILIQNSVVQTGDDCISIVSGSTKVRATGITCGPGHGISIGSLGEGSSEAFVSDVLVNKATIIGTSNGVRIKTWQGGHGYARNIAFQDILMRNVTNPIIIDQNYCDQSGPCHEKPSAVQVSNVLYRDIQGTSSTPVAVKFDCSKTMPCQGILMQNVKLADESQEISKASCSNVKLDTVGSVSPSCT